LTIGAPGPIVKLMLESKPSLDRIFQALTDPTRRWILQQLTGGPATVGQLAKPLEMTLSAVVQHIQVLEQCGVISTRKAGRARHCQIDPDALLAAERWLTDRRALWERRLDRLGDILADDAQQSIRGRKDL
jgi:DNA-binding transcriptional ArsR family regulator